MKSLVLSITIIATALDKAALQALAKMPRFIPATIGAQPVKARHTMTTRFKIQNQGNW